MKKILFFSALMAMFLCSMAQNDRISYQAVVRDANNRLVTNTEMTVFVKIFNTPSTLVIYGEKHTVTSNANGLISLLVGDGTDKSGNWSGILWNTAKITTDIYVGSDLIVSGSTTTTAVPASLFAYYADSVNMTIIADYLSAHDFITGSVLDSRGYLTADSTAILNLQGQVADLQAANDALAARIAADSANIVNQLDQVLQQLADLQEQIAESFPLPTGVSTTAATNIEATSATAGGTVAGGNTMLVLERGVCWSKTLDSLSVVFSHQAAATAGEGAFSVDFNGLVSNTTYYLCAYATNIAGTIYGDTLTFSTTTPPILTTNAATNVTHAQATVGGKITSDGGAPVMAYGICWSTNANPTTADNNVEVGLDMPENDYSYTITSGLEPGVTYHVRAWAANSIGTGYGEDKSFTTKDTATVTTATVTGIYANKAIAGGNVTDDGDTTVTARGVKWGTAANNLDHTVAAAQGGTGAYTVNITGLTGGSTYYVSAYATNSVGTAYGDTLSFTTSDTIPVVTTLAPTSLVDTGATLKGNVVSECGSAITARGFRWGRLDEAQAHDTVAATAGTGEFNVVLTQLTEQTDYFVIAYATNGTGTAWGDTVKFTTPAAGPDYSCFVTNVGNNEIVDQETGRIIKVKDHQNNEYKIVQIGSQCWLAWNMRCTTSPSTTHSIVVSGSTSTKDFSSFTSKVAKDRFPGCDSCGLLYNWNAAMDVYKSGSAEVLSQGAGSQDATTSFQATIGTNHRGICPAGWHVPTPAEWNELESYVGQNYACGNNPAYVAKALAWNEGWSSANLWQTCEPGRDQETTNNATGFSARPQGQFASNYQYQSTYAYFWTTEQRYVSNQWSRAVTRSIFYSNPDLGKGTNTFKYNGNSVRCVRNAEN